MKSVNVTNAREKLYNLIDETNLSHEPIRIFGKRGNDVKHRLHIRFWKNK